MDAVIARKTWRTPEPIHTLVYFAPEAGEEYGRAGVTDWTAGYFGSRAAPLGDVHVDVVMSTFFNFHPDLVHQSMALARAATSQALLDARLRAADRSLRRVLGEHTLASPEMAEAAALARRAAEAASQRLEGRPLFAAHVALPWPDVPHLVLWHAQTLLREFRGDAHIAALVADGIAPVEALVMHGATGEVTLDALRTTRAWPDDAWGAAVEALASAGLISSDDPPTLTDEGARRRGAVEDATDRASLPAYEVLGEDGCHRLRELTRPWSKTIVAGGLPFGAVQQ